MRTFRNWTINIRSAASVETIINAILLLEVGESILINDILPIEEAKTFYLDGELSDSDGVFLDGQRIASSPIISIKRIDSGGYVAVTDRGLEYGFSLMQKYGVPTLLKWRFANEFYSYAIDKVLKTRDEFWLEEPVKIIAEALDFPGFEDGDEIEVDDAIGFAPAVDYPNSLVLMAQSGAKILLPLDQRVGFINTERVLRWHLTFDYYPSDKAEQDELRVFLKRFQDFITVYGHIPRNMFRKEYLEVPPYYGVGLESNKYSFAPVKRFMRIWHDGLMRCYAVIDESRGILLEFDMFHTDKIQKKLMRSVAIGKLSRRKIRRPRKKKFACLCRI